MGRAERVMAVFNPATQGANGKWSIELKGVQQLNASLMQLATHILPEVMERVLYEQAQIILQKSLELVPVDSGALRASGSVSLPSDAEGQFEEEEQGAITFVMIGYGDTAVDYAIPVHERADLYHKPPTQWKYLEQPVLEHADELARALALGVEEAAQRISRSRPNAA